MFKLAGQKAIILKAILSILNPSKNVKLNLI